MKKIFVSMLVVIIMFSFAGCGEGKTYKRAIELMNEGQYNDAILTFETLGDYKDSADKIIECEELILGGKYDDAMALMNEKKYDDAIKVFEALGTYKDSTDKIKDCKYNKALMLLDEKKVVEAYNALLALDGYKDTKQKADEIRNKYPLSFVKTGDYIKFGKYEQDYYITYEKEDIEWLVLEVTDGKALLISKYGLECKQYNSYYNDYFNTTWEKCTLRSWLNNSFINVAFNEKEKGRLVTTTVPADKNPEHNTNPGKDTKDKVFVLSLTEVQKYLPTNEDRFCQSTLTAYKNGALWTYSGGSSWWLRTPDYEQDVVVIVSGNAGEIGNKSVGMENVTVRPAMWIDISAK